MTFSVAQPSRPDATDVAAIRALAAAVAAGDGRDPLSDQALTRLGSPDVAHVLVTEANRLVGYGQLDGESLEIAAESPAIAAVLEVFADRPVLVWTHGRASRLTAALAVRGFRRDRELFQLRRPLAEADALAAPPVPAGVELRPFVVGRDEDAWLRVNAAAFADHREQGGWTSTDLAAREQERWFDPSGFLLAWRGSELLGFHWTKIHPDGAGEVYVIGVDPAAQGLGLGRILLLHGLGLLRARGCPFVLLYVDGSNTAARGLYERTGFVEHDLDAQWSSPAHPATSLRDVAGAPA